MSDPTYDEGGVLPTGTTVVRNDYRDGTFRCPSGGSEGGDECPDSPAA